MCFITRRLFPTASQHFPSLSTTSTVIGCVCPELWRKKNASVRSVWMVFAVFATVCHKIVMGERANEGG